MHGNAIECLHVLDISKLSGQSSRTTAQGADQGAACERSGRPQLHLQRVLGLGHTWPLRTPSKLPAPRQKPARYLAEHWNHWTLLGKATLLKTGALRGRLEKRNLNGVQCKSQRDSRGSEKETLENLYETLAKYVKIDMWPHLLTMALTQVASGSFEPITESDNNVTRFIVIPTTFDKLSTYLDIARQSQPGGGMPG